MLFDGKPKRPIVNKTLTLDCSCEICEFHWELNYIGSLSEPDPPRPACPNCGMTATDSNVVDDTVASRRWRGSLQCFVCNHQWLGIIDIPADVSYPLFSLECGKCGGMTGIPAEVSDDRCF